MMAHSLAPYAAFLGGLLEPALRSLSLGLLAALLLAILRVKSAEMRLVVWTLVLYAALAMPFLALALPRFQVPVPRPASEWILAVRAALSGPAPVEARALPAAAIASPVSEFTVPYDSAYARPTSASSTATVQPESHRRNARSLPPTISSASTLPQESWSGTRPASPSTLWSGVRSTTSAAGLFWPVVASLLYVLVVVVLLARIALGALLGHGLVRGSDRVSAPLALRVLFVQARAFGLPTAPRLVESDLVSVPVTLGILRPAIVLPHYWRKWDQATLSAVMAHEISHVARRDALTQRLSLLHRAIFWFSPLSWWLNRALIDAAEQASDEAVLAAGADRAFYAETLLGFFAALSENTGRVYWQGVSMAAPGQAERRVDLILNWKGAMGMRFKTSVRLALASACVPVVLLAAAAHPATKTLSENGAALQAAGTPQAPQASAAPAAQASAAPHAAPAPDSPPARQGAEPSPALPPAPELPSAPPPLPLAAPVAPVPEPSVTIVSPEVSIEPQQLSSELKLQIENSLGLEASPSFDYTPLMDGSLQTFFQLKPLTKRAQKDTEGLKKLRQQLDALKKQDTNLHPEVLRLEKQIADLEAGLTTQIQPFTFVFPFNGQTKPFVIGSRFGGDRFVIVSNSSPIIMSGDSQDVEHATALRSKISGDFIWFQRDEKSYIIRDPNLVNQARSYFKPEQDLGDQQAALGKQQRDLGDQMRGLGDKARDTKVNLPDMSADMQKLMDQMKQLSASGGTPQQLGDLQRQLGDLQRQIGRAESQAMEPQRQTGDQMRELGAKMRELGAQQRDLGSKQREAAQQAQQQMKQLLDDALHNGTAQPE